MRKIPSDKSVIGAVSMVRWAVLSRRQPMGLKLTPP